MEDGRAANRLGRQEGALTEVRHLDAVHGNLRVLLALKEAEKKKTPDQVKRRGRDELVYLSPKTCCGDVILSNASAVTSQKNQPIITQRQENGRC